MTKTISASVSRQGCPLPSQYEEWVSAGMQESEYEALADHLNSCPQCVETVQTLVADLTVIQNRPDWLGEDPAGMSRLVERLLDWPAKWLGRNPVLRATVAAPVSDSRITNSGQTIDDRVIAFGQLMGLFEAPEQSGDLGTMDRYRIERLLGQGGVGFVFLAHDKFLDRKVALKVLRPDRAGADADARRRFVREARLAAGIQNKNLVTVYDVGEYKSIPYLAMELLDGETLEDRLQAGSNLSVEEILWLAKSTVAGLSALHQKGLVHRDIKPANIWLSPPAGDDPVFGQLKLLDFGLVRAIQDDVRLTRSGMIVGTPAFMAPEQARGEATDVRTDLFSLGVVLYELCTGRRPFEGDNLLAVLTSLAVTDPARIETINPAIPKSLANLTHQLLEKKADRRPASALEVAERLDKIDPLVTESDSPTRQRSIWGFILGASLIMSAAAAGVYQLDLGHGNLVISGDLTALEIVTKGNLVTVKDSKSGKQFQITESKTKLPTGQYQLEIKDPASGLEFSSSSITVKWGSPAEVTIAYRPENKADSAVTVFGQRSNPFGSDRQKGLAIAGFPMQIEQFETNERFSEQQQKFERMMHERMGKLDRLQNKLKSAIDAVQNQAPPKEESQRTTLKQKQELLQKRLEDLQELRNNLQREFEALKKAHSHNRYRFIFRGPGGVALPTIPPLDPIQQPIPPTAPTPPAAPIGPTPATAPTPPAIPNSALPAVAPSVAVGGAATLPNVPPATARMPRAPEEAEFDIVLRRTVEGHQLNLQQRAEADRKLAEEQIRAAKEAYEKHRKFAIEQAEKAKLEADRQRKDLETLRQKGADYAKKFSDIGQDLELAFEGMGDQFERAFEGIGAEIESAFEGMGNEFESAFEGIAEEIGKTVEGLEEKLKTTVPGADNDDCNKEDCPSDEKKAESGSASEAGKKEITTRRYVGKSPAPAKAKPAIVSQVGPDANPGNVDSQKRKLNNITMRIQFLNKQLGEKDKTPNAPFTSEEIERSLEMITGIKDQLGDETKIANTPEGTKIRERISALRKEIQQLEIKLQEQAKGAKSPAKK